jgi:primase-polymerase (primpol)-like protein
VVNSPIVENIPQRLTERPQWVNWRLEERAGKPPTKVPYTPGTLRRASSTDLMTWRTFSEALAAYEAGEPPYAGIGFVFCNADPYVGIDLDDCRDPETGKVAKWAQELIDSVQEGYVEISPSGTGIHVIVEGTVRGGGMRKGKLEMYGRDRFFTITGRIL